MSYRPWLLAATALGLAHAAVSLLWLAVLRRSRPERLLAWTAGGFLTLYGGVLAIAGIAVVGFGAADISASDDPYALKWHAFFWDPWFLLWGLCTLATMRLSAPKATVP